MFGWIDDVLSVITGVIKFIVDTIIAFAKWCFAHPKTAGAIALALALSYGAYRGYTYVHGLQTEVKTLTSENTKLIGDNAILTNDLSTAKTVNDGDQRIIDEMTTTAKKLNGIIFDLRKKNTIHTTELDDLQKRINALTAADDGPVANVLKEAIKGIDENRAERQKEWEQK